MIFGLCALVASPSKGGPERARGERFAGRAGRPNRTLHLGRLACSEGPIFNLAFGTAHGNLAHRSAPSDRTQNHLQHVHIR
jgi:hypothetical protein